MWSHLAKRITSSSFVLIIQLTRIFNYSHFPSNIQGGFILKAMLNFLKVISMPHVLCTGSTVTIVLKIIIVLKTTIIK